MCALMNEMGMQPSRHQFAVAVSAVINFEKSQRQVWNQPAGTGKSRTLISMIYAFYKLTNKSKFNVYFANQEQIDCDKHIFDELNRHLNSQGREVSINIINKDTFTNSNDDALLSLLDEADYFLLDVAKFRVNQRAQFVGMTATPLKHGDVTMESRYLKEQLEVSIFDT